MSGRNAPRSKNGCQTCRQRKVKCDETRPICNRCGKLSINCEWGFSSKHSTKDLQLHHAQRSQQWYLAYLRRNYGAQATSTSASWTTKELVERGRCSTTTTTTITTTPWPWSDGSQTALGRFTPQVPFTGLLLRHHDSRIMELSSPEITCSNALTMTAADQTYFRYFPSSSVVFFYMKSWEWSSLGFLYKGPAAANKIIMRMMLAIAASDMYRQGYCSSTIEKELTRRRAQYHYEVAVQEFRQYIEEHGSASTSADGNFESRPEMIFSIMFLMITYEWYFGHSVKNFQMHIDGVRCLITAHPEVFLTKNIADTMLMTGVRPDNGMSLISSQLLLWILYVTFNIPPQLEANTPALSMANLKDRYMEISGHPRGLTGSLYDSLIESGHSALHPDYLHQCARIWGRCLWAEEYPETEILDDMENHRALELLHHAIIIWNKIWQLALGNNKDSMTPETLFTEIMRIRELYSDMFITAKFTTSLSSHRALYTIYFAVCTFEAQILYHRRIFHSKTRPANNIQHQALVNILDLLYRQYSVEPKLLQRLLWPLFMMMIETKNPIHRDWAEKRIREVKPLHEGNIHLNTLVDMFVKREKLSLGEEVDLFEILHRQYRRLDGVGVAL